MVPNVSVTQHVAILHRLTGLLAVEEEMALAPSVSVLGCELRVTGKWSLSQWGTIDHRLLPWWNAAVLFCEWRFGGLDWRRRTIHRLHSASALSIHQRLISSYSVWDSEDEMLHPFFCLSHLMVTRFRNLLPCAFFNPLLGQTAREESQEREKLNQKLSHLAEF